MLQLMAVNYKPIAQGQRTGRRSNQSLGPPRQKRSTASSDSRSMLLFNSLLIWLLGAQILDRSMLDL
ncbi:hypothetical protein AB1N83_004360 [Pleurotus pulmonarius]